MKKKLILTVGAITLALAASTALAATGEELFKQHCNGCHPDGGNIIKPDHTLHKKALAKEGIKDAKGIVKYMRAPSAGMTTFDAKTLSDKDAKAIADYVLKTFK